MDGARFYQPAAAKFTFSTLKSDIDAAENDYGMPTPRYPNLYEINTRVWLRRFGSAAGLRDVPADYWKHLAQQGIHYVWLMGVWRTRPEVVNRYALEPGLQQDYARALRDWSEHDLIGSPYAIDRYELAPDLGTAEDLAQLRRHLHENGLKLILDFVPNHFHAETSLLAERPEIFLQVDAEWLSRDSHTFYQLPHDPEHTFAHGKDPHFPAWLDTVQLDYTRPETQQFMREQLLRLAGVCDGLRCDMAMLPLREVFRRTWGYMLPADAGVPDEFWPGAIGEVKTVYPDFVFLAEVYWDLEWLLQQHGFDYTYDKRLLDRIKHEPAHSIRLHLLADPGFQERSARFLENHDEERILHAFDTRRAQAAALIAYTVPGMRFFYDGQWEGRRTRLPVQLGREPRETYCVCPVNAALASFQIQNLPHFEPVCHCTAAYYERLLTLLREPALQQGAWQLLEVEPADSEGYLSVLAWEWRHGDDHFVIAVNYQPHATSVRLPLPAGQWHEYFTNRIYDMPANGQPQLFYPWQYLVLYRSEG